VVPFGLCASTVLAAPFPPVRAGRLPAITAITAGSYGAQRLASALPLARLVALGIAAPFSRPSRFGATTAVITLGLTAVVLAAGLDSSLAKVNAAGSGWHGYVTVAPADHSATSALHEVLRTQPGSIYVGEATTTVSVREANSQLALTACQGDASGFGWDMASGHWYQKPGEVVVNIAYPATASLRVGETIHMTVNGKAVTTRIVGEVYAPVAGLGALFTDWQARRFRCRRMDASASRRCPIHQPGLPLPASLASSESGQNSAGKPWVRTRSFMRLTGSLRNWRREAMKRMYLLRIKALHRGVLRLEL